VCGKEHILSCNCPIHACMQTGLITKLGIDATRPLARPSEKFEQAKRPVNEKIATIIEEMRKSL